MPDRTRDRRRARPLVGAALMLDLQDSTFVWDQKPALAEEVINTFDRMVKVMLEKNPRLKGKIGNFTGDGYLLLFELPEHAVNYCARLVTLWEEPRQRFEKQLDLRPDKRYLLVRSGVEFGRYHRMNRQFLGSAINRAQRCEVASKKYIEQNLLKREAETPPHFAVFVTQSVRDNIQISNYHVSRQLEAEFKGIEDYDCEAEDYATPKTFIYALWPRSLTGGEGEYLSDSARARKVADAISLSEASDRVLREAEAYVDIARGKVDEYAADLIDKSIGQYTALLAEADLPEKIRSTFVERLAAVRKRWYEKLPGSPKTERGEKTTEWRRRSRRPSRRPKLNK